ncbi:multidrug resistance protein MdtA [mine drainage metagenome]|uniref:Multidrug resistance protein MdtA n=1 Tax=mine drainage metagenome TaxID=410659 RepID=A0A1J5TH19_9ZZZZ
MNMHIKRKPLIIGIALLALVLASGGAWVAGTGAAKAEPTAPAESRPALTVRTTVLHQDKWGRTLSANGSILPWQEAIISAQVQGVRLAEVKVSIGDHVKQGDVLVTLDNFARLGDDPAATHSAQGRIVAPYDGVISAASANSGSMSQPGAELFRLIRNGRLEWRAELTAEELMLLRKGMTAEVAVGEGRVIKGAVRAISPAVNLQTRYGYALVTLPDSAGVIAGLFAHGTFDIGNGKRTLLSLPQSAVLQRGSMTFVLVVGSDNHVHEREVKVGQRNGDRIEIKQGLKPDEPVVESGGAFLTEGDVVQVVKGQA